MTGLELTVCATEILIGASMIADSQGMAKDLVDWEKLSGAPPAKIFLGPLPIQAGGAVFILAGLVGAAPKASFWHAFNPRLMGSALVIAAVAFTLTMDGPQRSRVAHVCRRTVCVLWAAVGAWLLL